MSKRSSCPSWSKRPSAQKFSALDCSQPLAFPRRKGSDDDLNGSYRNEPPKMNHSSSSGSKIISSRMMAALYDEVKSPTSSKERKNRRRALKDKKPPSCPIRKVSSEDLVSHQDTPTLLLEPHVTAGKRNKDFSQLHTTSRKGPQRCATSLGLHRGNSLHKHNSLTLFGRAG